MNDAQINTPGAVSDGVGTIVVLLLILLNLVKTIVKQHKVKSPKDIYLITAVRNTSVLKIASDSAPNTDWTPGGQRREVVEIRAKAAAKRDQKIKIDQIKSAGSCDSDNIWQCKANYCQIIFLSQMHANSNSPNTTNHHTLVLNKNSNKK